MTESGYYPPGAEHDPNAPWNQADNPEREIEVTVSVTLSKTVKIKVSDYEITDSGKDEDGEYFEDIDYSNCDLKGAVEEQIVLPQKAWNYIAPKSKKEVNAVFDLKGWNVDDFEVIEEVQKVELSAVSVSEVPVRVTNAYLNTGPSEPVSITGTVSVDNFPSSGTEL